MLLLTDLENRGHALLESPGMDLEVKPGIRNSGDFDGDFLGEFFSPNKQVNESVVSWPGCGWSGLAMVEEADSSQYDALLMATRGPGGLPGPVATVALTGKGFHGNRRRPWVAARGNLHLSCAAPVDLDVALCVPAVPAIPAVAVCDALQACAPHLDPSIKWVNDVLLDGAKVAGVLAAAQSRGSRMLSLVYGVGLNVAVAPPVEPTLFVPRVTCLHDEPGGSDLALGVILRALLDALWNRMEELRCEGPAPAIQAYRHYCGDVGRRVRVWSEGLQDTSDAESLPAPVAEGTVLRLDDNLALHVEGAPAPLNGGRLAHVTDQD